MPLLLLLLLLLLLPLLLLRLLLLQQQLLLLLLLLPPLLLLLPPRAWQRVHHGLLPLCSWHERFRSVLAGHGDRHGERRRDADRDPVSPQFWWPCGVWRDAGAAPLPPPPWAGCCAAVCCVRG
jgi:hypothetical protein